MFLYDGKLSQVISKIVSALTWIGPLEQDGEVVSGPVEVVVVVPTELDTASEGDETEPDVADVAVVLVLVSLEDADVLSEIEVEVFEDEDEEVVEDAASEVDEDVDEVLPELVELVLTVPLPELEIEFDVDTTTVEAVSVEVLLEVDGAVEVVDTLLETDRLVEIVDRPTDVPNDVV